MEIFKARPSLNMSLILIAVIYNVYFSPPAFKYAILMQKVKYLAYQLTVCILCDHSSCGVWRFGGV